MRAYPVFVTTAPDASILADVVVVAYPPPSLFLVLDVDGQDIAVSCSVMQDNSVNGALFPAIGGHALKRQVCVVYNHSPLFAGV